MTRFGFVMITYAAMLSVTLTSVFHPAPKLLWNVGASVPYFGPLPLTTIVGRAEPIWTREEN